MQKALLIYKRSGIFTRTSTSNNSNFNWSNGDYKHNNFNKSTNKKLLKTAIIVIIAVFIANSIIDRIEPTMNILCKDMAKSIATKVSNEQATIVMR